MDVNMKYERAAAFFETTLQRVPNFAEREFYEAAASVLREKAEPPRTNGDRIRAMDNLELARNRYDLFRGSCECEVKGVPYSECKKWEHVNDPLHLHCENCVALWLYELAEEVEE